MKIGTNKLDEKAEDPKFRLRAKEKGSAFFYDINTSSWQEERIKLQFTHTPFAEGGIRAAYYAIVYFEKGTKHPKGGTHTCVLKVAKQKQDEQVYFLDVAMQQYSNWWATEYNKKNPPKRVRFSDAFVIKLEKGETYGAEDYIEGQYMKHSDNNGWVANNSNQTPMRNTPHAFSHFTYESSQHRFVIVDIQGVGDYYTDPQIHTSDRRGFGLGNLGQEGINRFLATHQCNALCKSFGLPPTNKPLPPLPNTVQYPGPGSPQHVHQQPLYQPGPYQPPPSGAPGYSQPVQYQPHIQYQPGPPPVQFQSGPPPVQFQSGPPPVQFQSGPHIHSEPPPSGAPGYSQPVQYQPHIQYQPGPPPVQFQPGPSGNSPPSYFESISQPPHFSPPVYVMQTPQTFNSPGPYIQQPPHGQHPMYNNMAPQANSQQK